MYNLRPIGKIMRCSLLIGNIDGIDLYIANIKVHFYPPSVSHLGQFNVLKSVLYIEKLAVAQQIILNRNMMT